MQTQCIMCGLDVINKSPDSKVCVRDRERGRHECIAFAWEFAVLLYFFRTLNGQSLLYDAGRWRVVVVVGRLDTC